MADDLYVFATLGALLGLVAMAIGWLVGHGPGLVYDWRQRQAERAVMHRIERRTSPPRFDGRTARGAGTVHDPSDPSPKPRQVQRFGSTFPR